MRFDEEQCVELGNCQARLCFEVFSFEDDLRWVAHAGVLEGYYGPLSLKFVGRSMLRSLDFDVLKQAVALGYAKSLHLHKMNFSDTNLNQLESLCLEAGKYD